MNQQPSEIALGKFYALVVLLIFILTVLCLASAIGLALYVDRVEKPSEAVESLVSVLSHCVTLFVGGFVGVLTGPGFARFSQR